MKITFVVPALNLSGGLRVVSIYAKLLAEKGHEVTVVSPNKRMPTLKERVKSTLNWKGYKFNSNFDESFFSDAIYDVTVLDSYRSVTCNDVPDADIVIATFWNTAEWVADFPSSKGIKVYFLQGYEVHSWLPVERVKATFTLPFKKIVVSEWIANIMIEAHGVSDVTIVGNAVDLMLFNATERKKNIATTFGMIYSNKDCKRSLFTFKCFKRFQEKYPLAKLVIFGTEDVENVVGLPDGAKYYHQPKQGDIRNIYAQCDAWLFTSNSEGFGLPILEAMACRTPVIGTRCGAAPELLRSRGGILVNVDEEEGLFSAMVDIHELEPDQWLGLSNKAYKEAQCHQWGDKVIQFEEALVECYEK